MSGEISKTRKRFIDESSRRIDPRSAGQIDRDRLLYCSAFARLAETTQVVSPLLGHAVHNRLTHSLKVGQIARRLAEKILRTNPHLSDSENPIDPDVAESAGLGHDLGHPPFGHIAEEELNRLVREAGLKDGYEGNAQSFRIVTRLASSDAVNEDGDPVDGLNLSRVTLNGLLKYPWAADSTTAMAKHKWGYYSSEAEVFQWVREGSPAEGRSHVAEIMDWADDITFAIHDLLDFFAAGMVPIDKCKPPESSRECEAILQGILSRKKEALGSESVVATSLYQLVEMFPFEADKRFLGGRQDHNLLHSYATSLISSFISSAEIKADKFTIHPEAKRQVEILKQFTWQYVILNPDLAAKQAGQRKAIRVVFKQLLDAAKKDEPHIFPSHARSEVEALKGGTENPIRLVADCISGMTERELMRFYRRIEGFAD